MRCLRKIEIVFGLIFLLGIIWVLSVLGRPKGFKESVETRAKKRASWTLERRKTMSDVLKERWIKQKEARELRE
jgi:hypothetical protein